MNADFVSDLDIVDQSTVEAVAQLYPAAQWLNGDPKMAAAGGVAHTGGLVLPTKYVDENAAPPPGWTQTNVTFGSGKTELVFAAPKPRLAVIRTRFRWFVNYNGVTTAYPREAYVAESGMRGHVQALCAVYGWDFPITVTFKGKASQEFEKLLKDWNGKVMDAANKAARANGGQARFPRFAFYMRLAPGPHIKVGQKGQESIITPPTLDAPSVIGDDYLSKVYVGRQKLVELQDAYRDSAEWAAAWGKPSAEPVEGVAPDEAPPADPETGEILEDAQPAPAVVDVWTQAQAEGAMKAAGVKPSTFKDALQRANGSFAYDPARDTALVRGLVNAAIDQF